MPHIHGPCASDVIWLPFISAVSADQIALAYSAVPCGPILNGWPSNGFDNALPDVQKSEGRRQRRDGSVLFAVYNESSPTYLDNLAR